MKTRTIRAALGAGVAGLALAASIADAQTAPTKNVSIEPTQIFPALVQWVNTHVFAEPANAAVPVVQPLGMVLRAPAPGKTYEPFPVIAGVPDLPLVGASLAEATSSWAPALNYQGVHMKLVVLDRGGRVREFRPLSAGLNNGERFKLRLSTTFDAVASVDQVVGDVWYGQRVGQVYPQAGMSVQMNAGETVDLPLGASEWFVMDSRGAERFVVSVRHPKAVGAARSDQPAYRQDAVGGSNYLQLVPTGTFPGIEQLIVYKR